MSIDKDKSIITQVAAKIAADLAVNGTSVDDFADKFVGVTSVLMDAIYGPQPEPQVYAPTINGNLQVTQPETAQMIQAVQQAFPTAQVNSSVTVKGKQHGPLPEWLVSACAKDGVTEVWDNRDSLSENPKRPWFKSTTGNKAYWAPRTTR